MKNILLFIFAVVMTNVSFGQSFSMGVVGGVFKNGRIEENFNPNANYSFEYFPEDQKFILGLSAKTVVLRNLRLEASVANTLISNKVVETVRITQQNLVQEREGKISYGKSNYLITLSPAYQFYMGDVHPYIGVEGGLAMPAQSQDKTGYVIGGRLGVDVELVDNLSAGVSFNYGQIIRVASTTRSSSFSYYRILFGLYYSILK